MSREQERFVTFLGLLVASLSLLVAIGSFFADMGIFGSPPPVVVLNPTPKVATPKSSKNRSESHNFFQSEEVRLAEMAQAAQEEIEALAGVETPGRRTEIVDRIKELSAQKSNYESRSMYYRQAASGE